MRSYHVVLYSGKERDIRATQVTINHGTLEFHNGPELIIAYSSGTWVMVEVERKDDQ